MESEPLLTEKNNEPTKNAIAYSARAQKPCKERKDGRFFALPHGAFERDVGFCAVLCGKASRYSSLVANGEEAL
jgi:hypothetical protein